VTHSVFLSSELFGPVDHDVVVAAVSELKPHRFVEEAQDGRDDEVIVFGRMMIHPD
jgi:hypothetical protein